VPSALVWILNTESYVFTDTLEVTEFASRYGGYGANITDGDRSVGNIFVRADYFLNASVVPVTIVFSHQDWTEIDSISMNFTPAGYSKMELVEAPSTGEGARFHPSQDGKRIQFSTDDLGWAGKHTVRWIFRVHLDSPENPQHAMFNFTLAFSMHRQKSMELTSLLGQASLNQRMIIHPAFSRL
jgi:hypothetical protein